MSKPLLAAPLLYAALAPSARVLTGDVSPVAGIQKRDNEEDDMQVTGMLCGAKVTLEHVPYRGGSEVARDLAAGTLEAGIPGSNSLDPVAESGKARPLPVTRSRRGGIQGLPTIADSGFPDFDLTSWNAIFCRGGTPEPTRQRLEAAINTAASGAEATAHFTAFGAERLSGRLKRERALVQETASIWAEPPSGTGRKIP